MSWKSIGLSILFLIITIGLLFATWFLFAVNIIPGIIGIVLLIVIPIRIRSKAVDEANGILDGLFAKYIAPIATAIVAAIVVMMMLNWIPFPFQ